VQGANSVWNFGSFELDLARRELRRQGHRLRLTAKPFDTLAFLVENRGQLVTREQLRASVWCGLLVTDPAIEHAVNKIRRALEDDPGEPKFIQTLWGKGYIFVGEVKCGSDAGSLGNSDVEEAQEPSGLIGGSADYSAQPKEGAPLDAHLGRHTAQVVAGSLIYGLLYVGAFVIETAYRFEAYARIAILLSFPILIWVCGTTMGALWIHRVLLARSRPYPGLIAGVVIGAAGALLVIFLGQVLPNAVITPLSFQGLTAHSAYLKDTTYFLAMAILFLVVPLHCVRTLEHLRNAGRIGLAAIPIHNQMACYLRPNALLAVAVGGGIWSQLSLAHIFEHLQTGRYMGFYMSALQIERFLGVMFCLECVTWYYRSLAALKHGPKS